MLLEAQGYLEFVTACDGDFSLSAKVRDELAGQALDLLSRIESPGLDEEEVLYLTGKAYQVMQRYHEAIGPLEEAVELNPQNLHTWLALGWCNKRIGRVDLAIESLQEALDIAPDEAIIYYNLACYWSLVGKPKRALAYLTQAFDLDPAYRDLVADEADFDAIRNHPGFLELTSVIV
jgi:tetratricopeptide (TPR) repeat protein